MNLENSTQKTLANIERLERSRYRYKVILYTVSVLIIITINLYTYERLFHNSATNRTLLRCTLTVALSQEPPQKARVDIQKCLDETK